MNRKVLSILMVLLGVTFQLALILPVVQAAPHTDITRAQAYAMIYSTDYPNLVVIDVRGATSPPEPYLQNFNNGHILGAINAPVLPPSPYDYTALDAWISSPEGQSHKNDEIIVYCRSGGRSNLASNRLDANGFTKVYDMLGGYQGWIGEGKPIIDVTATIDIKPETLNLKSDGKWVTCYIELPTPNSVNDIDIVAIKMCGSVLAASEPTQIGDYDSDTIPDLMVKFDRTAVQDLLDTGEKRLWVTFGLSNGKLCGGWDAIKVVG